MSKKLNSKQYFQSRKKGRKVDALAHEDYEGRKWTKTRVSSQQAMTPRSPNGETRLMKNQSSYGEYIAIVKLDPANWNI